MKNFFKYLKNGWSVLAELHTAIWLFEISSALFGFGLTHYLIKFTQDYHWPILLFALLLFLGLFTALILSYVGYRVKSIVTFSVGTGGAGGGGTIRGNRGTVIGGRGGHGGVSGNGGAGGSGFIEGDDGMIIGGDGGNCGTADGRGGRRSSNPVERANGPTQLWKYGYGGAGANTLEYNRRLNLLISIRTEYVEMFPDSIPFIQAGIDTVPTNWVNKRLEELNENWRVAEGISGYILPNL